MTEDKKINLFKLVNHAILLALFIVLVSFVISIVPCRLQSDTISFMNFCTLPPLFNDLNDLNTTYYWTSNNPITGLVYQFIISFLLYILIYLIFTKKVKTKRNSPKILDLTKKHR